MSPYCFRALRARAKRYAKVPRRLLVTCEYTLSEPEQELYDWLYSYCQKPSKLAFPEMKPYDLTLRLLDLQGSSSAAILQTLRGVIKRLKSTGNAGEELAELWQMERLAAGIEADAKLAALLTGLEQGFKRLGKAGAPRKALIFLPTLPRRRCCKSVWRADTGRFSIMEAPAFPLYMRFRRILKF